MDKTLMIGSSVVMIGSSVELIEGRVDVACLTMRFKNGLEVSATITQGAAVEMIKNLQAWTCRKIDQ